jgi:hypothetical protein
LGCRAKEENKLSAVSRLIFCLRVLKFSQSRPLYAEEETLNSRRNKDNLQIMPYFMCLTEVFLIYCTLGCSLLACGVG